MKLVFEIVNSIVIQIVVLNPPLLIWLQIIAKRQITSANFSNLVVGCLLICVAFLQRVPRIR